LKIFLLTAICKLVRANCYIVGKTERIIIQTYYYTT